MTTCMTSTERGERVNLTCTTSTSMMPARSTGCFAAQTCQGTAPRRVRRVGVLIPTGAGRNRCGRSTAGARPRRGCTSTCERMPVLAFSGTSGGSSPPAGGYAAVMWRSCGGYVVAPRAARLQFERDTGKGSGKGRHGDTPHTKARQHIPSLTRPLRLANVTTLQGTRGRGAVGQRAVTHRPRNAARATKAQQHAPSLTPSSVPRHLRLATV